MCWVGSYLFLLKSLLRSWVAAISKPSLKWLYDTRESHQQTSLSSEKIRISTPLAHWRSRLFNIKFSKDRIYFLGKQQVRNGSDFTLDTNQRYFCPYLSCKHLRLPILLQLPLRRFYCPLPAAFLTLTVYQPVWVWVNLNDDDGGDDDDGDDGDRDWCGPFSRAQNHIIVTFCDCPFMLNASLICSTI